MRLTPFVSTIAGVLLIILLVWMVDGASVIKGLSQVSAGDAIAGLLIVQVQIVLSALRWRFTAGRLGQTIGWIRAVGEYYVATAVNQLLPGGMAGDVLRGYRMRAQGVTDWSVAAKGVVLERLSGQVVFFLVCAPAFLLLPGLPFVSDRPWTNFLWLPGLALVLGAAIIFARRFGGWSRDLREVFIRGGAFLVQGGLSVAVVSSYIGLFMLCASATGTELSWQDAMTVIPLCLLSMLIPTGFGGWGTREAAASALWPLIGLASAEGVAASLLYGGFALAGALPGIVILLAGATTRKRQLSTNGGGDRE